MKKNKQNAESIDWVNMIKMLVLENAKVIAVNAADEVKRKVRIAVSESTQKFIVSTLIFVGLIFLMVGLAIFINEAVQMSNSVGYIIVGVLVVVGGVIMKDGIGKKKEN